MDSKTSKIRSHADADEFYNWLTDNPQVTNIQGYELTRFPAPDNRVIRYGNHIFDHDFYWSRRREINDWIDRFAS